MLESCYTNDDIITTNIYGSNLVSCRHHVNQREIDDKLILKFAGGNLVIGFDIKSKIVSTGYTCVYGMINSSFHIMRGRNFYPYLSVRDGSLITLILDKNCVTEVVMISIPVSKCDIMRNYSLCYGEYFHIITKVNEFSPKWTYHNIHICWHGVVCSFSNCDNVHYVGDNYDVTNIDPIIMITKIHKISKKVVQLLNVDNNYMIKDIVLHIGVFLYHVV